MQTGNKKIKKKQDGTIRNFDYYGENIRSVICL